MHNSSQLRKEFIKKWIHGLQICCSSKKHMNLMERKKKIKLSADIALASAKNATTSWSKALIADVKIDEENMILINNLSGPESKFVGAHDQRVTCHKRIRSKKILKKSCGVGKRIKRMGSRRSDLATCIAERLVKKRTKVLKRLVPGGESMDEVTIIKEALDYILSLRVQVDVMKNVVNATGVLD
ncbi:transcription factor IBH1-like 1 [Cynara cardunculus var. scolymus]|uniref:Myc-type, basic helix-loop-helix (BHLH) domain-containing protein n=1 Tax=Cynara cardunculus var. scolymus TaxID=59895 RepID=A0A103XN26_CYNCS|nr:transcription factor IBH1-like 1 [Cynara cardunculus var. scolymus]KVH93628.1 Myc-type, basic helix-loop-helix (bHLH) domain-containing protein [Cynara cardunculus var. scolymus]